MESRFTDPRSNKMFTTLTPELQTLVEQSLSSREYRKQRNSRPDVKEKRRVYNKKRNDLVRSLLKKHNDSTPTT